MEREMSEKERRDELLSAYLDDELSREERTRLEEQLAGDETLRGELEALRRTVALVRGLPPVPVPRNFLLSTAASPRPRPAAGTRRWLAPFLTATTAVAGLFLLVAVVGGGLLLGRQSESMFQAAPEPTEEPTEYAYFYPEGEADAPLTEEPTVALEEMEPALAATEAAGREAAAEPTVEPAPADEAASAPTEAPTEAPPAPLAGGAAVATAAAVASPSPASPLPTLSPTEAIPSPKPGEERGPEDKIDDGQALAVVDVEEREETVFTRLARNPWPAVIALVLVLVGLITATILAWRARRRNTS